MFLTKFNVAGRVWSLYLTDQPTHEDGTLCEGLTDPVKFRVEVKAGLSEKEKWEVFLHELTHAVLFSYFHDFDNEILEERMCDMVGVGFTSALRELFQIVPLDRAFSSSSIFSNIFNEREEDASVE